MALQGVFSKGDYRSLYGSSFYGSKNYPLQSRLVGIS